MIAYLLTAPDGDTVGVVLSDDENCNYKTATAARDHYCEQVAKCGIKGDSSTLGVSAIFEGVSLFWMPAAKPKRKRKAKQ